MESAPVDRVVVRHPKAPPIRLAISDDRPEMRRDPAVQPTSFDSKISAPRRKNPLRNEE
jgi:hypothetical protein